MMVAMKFCLWFLLIQVTKCAIRNFKGKLAATPEYIHYSEGFIVAPGYVDLSNLVFTLNNDIVEDVNEDVEDDDLGRELQEDPSIDIAVFRAKRMF